MTFSSTSSINSNFALETLLPTGPSTSTESDPSESRTEIVVDRSSDVILEIDPKLRIQIDRPVYNHSIFDAEFDFVQCESDPLQFSFPKINVKDFGKFAKSLFPPLDWIPKYKKSWIFRDIVVGLTVSILSIPQAMAYASLASVPPVVGLYSSFFPTLLYAVFGTSKHIMYGMFAVPSLMVGSIIDDLNPANPNASLYEKDVQKSEAIEICATITFCLGLIFIIMAILQLHSLTAYLSDNLVAGFTTGASVHVLFSQIPKLFAIKVQRREGFFKLGFITYDLLTGIKTSNMADFSISVISIGILMTGRYLVNPKVTKKLKVPIPFELLIVILWTIISKIFFFEKNFNVLVVSTIPTGVPTPQLPDFSRVPSLLPRTAPIAVVIFGVTISVGKLFAKKHDYKFIPAQDLRAMGFIQLVVSFFRCHPGSGSLSRSAVASQLGGKSQFVSVTCASVVFIVVLWLGPLLYHLPVCVLASIIFVALQGMLSQVKSLPVLWRTSKIDFFTWIVAFLATVLYDVSEGLLIAVGFALFTVILRTQVPRSISVGRVPGTELYKDLSKYRKLELLPRILILRYDAPLLFVNASRFVSTTTEIVLQEHQNSKIIETEDSDPEDNPQKPKNYKNFLVLDLSSVAQIDQMGVEALKDLHTEVTKLGTTVLIATPKSPIRDLFCACGLFKAVPKSQFFPSIHDAVLYAQNSEGLS